MRIEPKRDTLAALQPTASTEHDDAFASELASAKSSFSETPSIAAAAADDGPPLAERWGQYGTGATADGYGAPNPALYADAPVGPHEPASPLNPNGVTTKAAFIVPGYTGRGTPVPPGFYNLAYYNLYLQEGGTPLIGFPQLADGATISETYGTFGDGAERATSFLTGLVDDGCERPATDAVVATASPATPAAASVPAAAVAATIPSASKPSTGATMPSPAPASSSDRPASTPADAGTASSSGDIEVATSTVAKSNDIATLLRSELTALFADLLRSV